MSDDLNRHKFSYDIQQKQYTKGEEKFNTEMMEDGYIFQFDRLYTTHEEDIKTYKFIAKLTNETIEKETTEGEITKVSDSKNAPFRWQPLENEIWHIDTTFEAYNAMVNSIWRNYYNQNNERLEKNQEEQMNSSAGVSYYDVMTITFAGREKELPEDWLGKDKIYFIIDLFPEENLDNNKDYSENPPNTDGIINEAIQTIVLALTALANANVNYADVVNAGIKPEEYGFKNENGKIVKL